MKVQNNHHWQSPEICLNKSPTTGDTQEAICRVLGSAEMQNVPVPQPCVVFENGQGYKVAEVRKKKHPNPTLDSPAQSSSSGKRSPHDWL